MDASQVKEQILNEIKNHQERLNWGGIELNKCLVEPKKRFYRLPMSDEKVELWLVFEEWPDKKGGYQIVYDEAENIFGLACDGKREDVVIGFYGSFSETLAGM